MALQDREIRFILPRGPGAQGRNVRPGRPWAEARHVPLCSLPMEIDSSGFDLSGMPSACRRVSKIGARLNRPAAILR
jgi:hypothetical protein